MADIRLRKITVDPLFGALDIREGTVGVADPTPSTDLLSASVVLSGGLSIQCSMGASSSENGGGLTIAGGLAVFEKAYFGGDIVIDSSQAAFKIEGITQDRMHVDTINAKSITFAPDGVNRTCEMRDDHIVIFPTTPATNASTAALVVSGGAAIGGNIIVGTELSFDGGAALSAVEGGCVLVDSATEETVLNVTRSFQANCQGVFGDGFQEFVALVAGTSGHTLKSDATGNGALRSLTLAVGSNEALTLHSNGALVVSAGSVCLSSATITAGSLVATGENNVIGNVFTKEQNVGIGTTSPSTLLSVNGGTADASSVVLLVKAKNADPVVAIESANSRAKWYVSADDDRFTLSDDGGSKLFTLVASTGNVGIGTTSPTSALDVSGDISGAMLKTQSLHIGTSSGSSAILLTDAFSDAALSITCSQGNWSFSNNDADFFLEFVDGDVVINSSTDASSSSAGALRIGGGAVVRRKLHVLGNVVASNGSNTLGNLFTASGNVGINTSSPQASLHVSSSTGAIVGETWLVDGKTLRSSLTGMAMKQRQTNAPSTLSIVPNGTSTSSCVSLYNADVQQTGNASVLKIESMGEYFSVASEGEGTESALPIELRTGASIAQLYLDVSGNVGVGTSEPVHALDVSGTVRALVGVFTATTDTTYLGEGAVVVTGGVSIAKNCTIGGNVAAFGDVGFHSTNDAASPTSGGALTVLGGTGITKTLRVGGDIRQTSSGTSEVGAFVAQRDATFVAPVRVTDTTVSVSKTTGSIIIEGGAGVLGTVHARNVVVGTDTHLASSSELGRGLEIVGDASELMVWGRDGNAQILFAQGASKSVQWGAGVRGTAGTFSLFEGTGAAERVSVTTTGVSIASTKNVSSGDAALVVQGGASIKKSAEVGGGVSIASTEQSIDANTGALTVKGGVGISKNLNVDGNATINGDLFVNGSTSTINAVNTTLSDNVFCLNAGPSGSRDAGIVVQRFQQDNDTAFGDVVGDEYALRFVLPIQSGVTSSEVILPSGASSTSSEYVGWWVKVESGFSSGQVRRVTAYNGTTKRLTLSSAFTGQNPGANDVLLMYNKPYVGLFYDELVNTFVVGATAKDPSNAAVSVADRMPLSAGATTVAGLFSTHSSALSATDNASSSTAGGSLTVHGGVGIAKDVYVGGDLYVRETKVTPLPGDVPSQATFFGGNNVSSPVNVTGLAFNAAHTRGFDVYITVSVEATASKYANFIIRGVNKGTGGWEIVSGYVGDETSVEFTVSSQGNIQYTSGNYAGFASLKMNFKVITTGT